jgi:hypothetical protein
MLGTNTAYEQQIFVSKSFRRRKLQVIRIFTHKYPRVSSCKAWLSKLVKKLHSVGLVCSKKRQEKKKESSRHLGKVSNLTSQHIICFTQETGVSMGLAFITRQNKFRPYEITVVHELERIDCCCCAGQPGSPDVAQKQ